MHPWAESLVLSTESAPKWLCDVATKKYSPDVSKALGEYGGLSPFEAVNRTEVDDDYLSCLYLRYERHELSWASFLDLASRYTDGADGSWECEELFGFLNTLEDADFSPIVEERQREGIATKLGSGIARIRPIYDDLRAKRRCES